MRGSAVLGSDSLATRSPGPPAPGAPSERKLPRGGDLVFSAHTADSRSRRAAAIVLAVSVLVFVGLAPFAKLQLPAVPLFVPIYQSVLIVNDLVTAMLLFMQLQVTRSRALLVLACGYVFTAAMAFVHLLTFPGVFGPAGVLGGGAQTTGYMFVFWHVGFVVLAMAYTVLKSAEQRGKVPPLPSVPMALAAVLAAVLLLAAVATFGNDLLPPMLEGTRYSSVFNLGRYGQWVLSAIAIVLLWRARPHSLLDQWLLVVLCTWFIEIGLVGIFNAGRYDLGFYAGRLYGLLSSCFILAVLLWEQGRMYAGLLEARETARSEAELKANRDVLRLAMEGGRMGVWSVDLATGRLWCSAELEVIMGVPAGNVGKLRSAMRRVHRADRGDMLRALRASFQRAEDFAMELRFRQPGGAWRWLALHARPVVGDGALPTGLHGIGMDVTMRRRAEESARQLEAGFQTMADGISQLAWMARPDGWIYWYNRRWYEYTGTTPSDMEGWGWQSVHDPAVLPAVLDGWQRSIRTGEPFEMVFPLRAADGRYRSFLTRVVPFRDEDGNLRHWFGTNTDVTAQLELEAAMRQAERNKDEFLATLAHELRNPLAPIRTAVGLLKMLPSMPPQAQRLGEVLDRQSSHLSRLVEDLLDVSRIANGKVQLRLERVNLVDALKDAIDATRPAIAAAGHEFSVLLPGEPLWARADATRVTQMATNLLVNATKFTPRGGSIRLRACRDGARARIVVTDTGIGIAADEVEAIFGIFTQVAPAQDRGHGLGIGLALVRGLAELHGGHVQVRSDGPGRGSEFTLSLPLGEPDGAPSG